MKKVLFIDFDGTLCHDRFWRSAGLEIRGRIQDLVFKKEKEIADKWMRGEVSSEEINRLVSTELQIPFQNIWDIFVADCKGMQVSSSILKQINDLGDRFHTVLVTDNMDCFTRFTVPSLTLDSYFDLIVNSSEIRKRKGDNNGEVFSDVVSEFSSKLEDSTLIDDSQTVCANFTKLGGTSCLVTAERPLSAWLKSL